MQPKKLSPHILSGVTENGYFSRRRKTGGWFPTAKYTDAVIDTESDLILTRSVDRNAFTGVERVAYRQYTRQGLQQGKAACFCNEKDTHFGDVGTHILSERQNTIQEFEFPHKPAGCIEVYDAGHSIFAQVGVDFAFAASMKERMDTLLAGMKPAVHLQTIATATPPSAEPVPYEETLENFRAASPVGQPPQTFKGIISQLFRL